MVEEEEESGSDISSSLSSRLSQVIPKEVVATPEIQEVVATKVAESVVATAVATETIVAAPEEEPSVDGDVEWKENAQKLFHIQL
jgi:hypothetical protein